MSSARRGPRAERAARETEEAERDLRAATRLRAEAAGGDGEEVA